MCGIAGFIDRSLDAASAEAQLRRMLRRVAHRGPDGEGVWVDPPIAHGHRRLAVVDLTPAGRQPMISRSGRYVIALNGEIYNHVRLRNELLAKGAVFVGHSDTEVLLALIDEVGLEQALARCVGMFALALWDRRDHVLQLARDRLGEKPLFYGWHHGRFIWGSELTALAAHRAFEQELDKCSVALLLRYGYVPAPRSMFARTHKLPPGSVLSLHVPAGGAALGPETCSQTISTYWSALDVAQRGIDQPARGSLREAADRLEALLSDAVGLQMQADVPLGAFLSGGLDSSTVVALMQKQSSQAIRTYTIGFEEPGLDEAPFAAAVARWLGTEHRELYVTARDALEAIPQLAAICDEPLGDASQIPTLLVARLAKTEVTVSLSGDGGDELFAGYPRYAIGQRMARRTMRGAVSWLLGGAACLASAIAPVVRSRLPDLRWRLQRRQHWLGARDQGELADRLCYVSAPPVDLHAALAQSCSRLGPDVPLHADYLQSAMHRDRVTYLPDDLLVKTDRATMSAGLEGRCPFLDHRVVEFAASLPSRMLIGHGSHKLPLRELLFRHVPRDLVDRPKAGFNVPIARWFRNELCGPMREVIADRALESDLGIGTDRLSTLFADHRAGRADWSTLLWTVFSLWQWNRARHA